MKELFQFYFCSFISHLHYTYFTHYPTVSKIILYVKIMCVLVRIRNPPNIIIVQKLIDIDVTECVNMVFKQKKKLNKE